MKYLVWFLAVVCVVQAKEFFLPQDIYPYLNKKNPFYYQAIGKQYIAKGKERVARGALDTQLNASYDNKRYPITSGSYGEMGFLKPMSNGIEVSLGYRRAQGTQEYNNIKTGKDGELISSIKIPFFSVLNDISQNKVAIETARLSTLQEKHQSAFNVLGLYFNITKIYYQLLLQKQLVFTQKALVKKAKKTEKFINQQIKTGTLPEVMRIEIQQIIMQRQQAYIYEKNNFHMVKNVLLQYLGIEMYHFDKQYKLPLLKQNNKSLPILHNALKRAIKNRPDLKVIDVEVEKLVLQKEYNKLAAYPKFDMKFSTIYDPIYEEGYKVSLNFNIPIERNKYRGREEVLQKQNLLIQSEKLKSIRELKTNIANVYQKIKTKKEEIGFLKKELYLAHKLERVEIKKIHEGIGNLMFLNQREIASLQVKQKLLKSYYDLETYFLEVDYLLGIL